MLLSHRPSCHFRAPVLLIASFTAVQLCIGSIAAQAQSIDFETTPSAATPTDDAVLSSATPYTFAGPLQVSFGFDIDSNGSIDTDPVFEQAGTTGSEGTNIGFVGSSGIDAADPGFGPQLGQWFLRAPAGGSDFGRFVIQYTTPLTITAASGEIWDIDGAEGQPPLTEQYRVRAFDSSNNLLDTIDSPIGTLTTATAPLDGQPWVFNFSGLSASIDHIEITFIGTKPSGIGLAFNNFYPTTVAPEPAGAALLLAFASLAACTRRRR